MLHRYPSKSAMVLLWMYSKIIYPPGIP